MHFLVIAFVYAHYCPLVGEEIEVFAAMSEPKSVKILSRPTTRSGSTSSSRASDVTQNGRSHESTEVSFSDPLFPTSQVVRKKRGRPKKNQTAEGDVQISQDPDNPEVWSCMKCKVDFGNDNDKLMQCERCDGATCTKCLGMDDGAYDLLKGRLDLHWYCGTCDKLAMSAVKADWEIEERCASYMASITSRLDKMQESIDMKASKAVVDDIAVHVGTNKMLIDGANSDIIKLSHKIDLMYKEPEEIEKRKRNVVVRGLPERHTSAEGDLSDGDQNTDDVSIVHTDMSDMDVCNELFESIGVQVTPKAVHRLGKRKPDGAGRPIKVILNTEEEKTNILRSGPKVRNVDSDSVSFDPTKIFICPDMTILQRQEDVKIRQELRKKREEDPNGMWIIRGKKLIRRNPLPARPPDEEERET